MSRIGGLRGERLIEGRSQRAAAFGRYGTRRACAGLPWCKVPLGPRSARFGLCHNRSQTSALANREQGGVGSRITSRSKYGTKKPKAAAA